MLPNQSPFACQKRNSDALYPSPGNGRDFVYQSRGNGTDFASPLTAPPTTRVKTSRTQVDEKLGVLLQVFRGNTTNDRAAQMLRCMIPGCLGPAVGARDDLQEKACNIVGSELDQLGKEYEHAINRYDEMIQTLKSNLEIRLNARREYDVISPEALIQELAQLRGQLAKLQQHQTEAGKDITEHERQIKQLKEHISRLMGFHQNHYVPLSSDFRGTCHLHVPKLRSLGGGCEWLSSETENLRRMLTKYEEMSKTLDRLKDLQKHEEIIEALKKLEELLKKQGEQCPSWISDGEFQELNRALQRFLKAKEIIEELKLSENLPTATRKTQIQMLIQLFNGLDCEDCLVAGFEPAALEPPSKRGPWSHKVFETLENIIDTKLSDIRGKISLHQDDIRRRLQELIAQFESQLQDLRVKIDSQEADLLRKLEQWIQSLLHDPKNKLDNFESAHEGKKLTLQEIIDNIRRLREKEPGLEDEINRLRKQAALHEKMRLKWETLIKTVNVRIASIQAEKTKITKEFETFKSGPLAAYEWLRQHSNDDFTTRPEIASAGGYEPEVEKRIKALQDPLNNLENRTTRSKEMIIFSAPGCLCPGVLQRRPSQAEQCLLVGTALECQENALSQSVQTHLQGLLELGVFPHNLHQAALDAGSENDLTTFTNLVSELDEARKKACLHHSTTVRALTDAQTGYQTAKSHYDMAVNAVQTAENLIRTHFELPRDSETMAPLEADQHISQVLSFLKQQWKFEECLLGGLRPALKHRPSERGEWCWKVIKETQSQIEDKIEHLKQEVENKRNMMNEQADRVEAAKCEMETALKEKEKAEKLYQLGRELREKVKNLIDFRMTALAAYRWLHMHKSTSDHSMDHGSLLAITIKEFVLEVEVIEDEVTTVLEFKESMDFKSF